MTLTGDDADMYSNHPDQYGWPADPHDQPVNTSFTYTSPQGVTYRWPNGVAVGTEVLITAALDIICAQAGFECYPDPDPNVCGMWGAEIRKSRNSDDWSIHSWAIVTDLNAPWNPNATATPPAGPYRLPLNTGDLIWDLGCRWGGDWGDWMHAPEIHFSPAQVAQWTAEFGGDYQGGDDDMPLSDDDVNKIAKATRDLLLDSTVRGNRVDSATGKETAGDYPLGTVWGETYTNAGRSAYRSK